MSGEELQDILYQLSAVLILFIIFYIILSTMGLFRLKDLNFLPNIQKIAFSFYFVILVLCIFRISTIIYLIFYTSVANNSQDFGSERFNIFVILFPDFLFWIGMGSFFWLVFLMFYSSHMSNENLLAFNIDSSRCGFKNRSWKYLLVSMCIYSIVQIVLVGVFFGDRLDDIYYASMQTGFSIFIPVIISYFVYTSYKTFSGTFYLSEDLQKIAQKGNKLMIFILSLRFIFGLIGLCLIQCKFRESFNLGDSYYDMLFKLGAIAFTVFFLEIIPIYMGFHINTLKLCVKISPEPLMNPDESPIKKDLLIDDENKTSLEKEIRIKKKSSFDKTHLLDKLSNNLRKYEYDELSFYEKENQNLMNKFGTIQFANSDNILLISQTSNINSFEFCIRNIEIPAMNRFLLEDVERDMNKHIFLQNQMKKKIVRLMGYTINKKKESISLLYENMKNGSLKNLLANSQQQALAFDFKIRILNDLAKNCNDLHNLNIVHGHLTTNNIFFDNEFNLRIGDLLFYDLKKYTGYSKGYSNRSSYTAPEYWKDNGFIVLNPNNSADVYSFGIICWEVLTGETAFLNVKKNELKKLLIDDKVRPKIPAELDDELSRLIRCCWQNDAEKRPNFNQIINILQNILEMQKTY